MHMLQINPTLVTVGGKGVLETLNKFRHLKEAEKVLTTAAK